MQKTNNTEKLFMSTTLKNSIERISFDDLLDNGCTSGPWLKEVRRRVKSMHGETGDIVAALDSAKAIEVDVRNEKDEWRIHEQLPLRTNAYYSIFADSTSTQERDNMESAALAMDYVVKAPPVKAAALMPDACPTGPQNIPVGGVVSSTAIHPSYHSADVCCSVFNSTFRAGTDPKMLLDAVHENTHFGPIAYKQGKVNKSAILPGSLKKLISDNPIMKDMVMLADCHFGTQGDGNHFAFVGVSENDGTVHLVTHHGSRGLGAALYKEGKKAAQKWTERVCSEMAKDNAWIEPNSQYEVDYWHALQIVREWTKMNHSIIHQLAANQLNETPIDQYWNEHNFVFKRDDDLYYHAKGATPAFEDWAHDATDKTLIPLNMGAPLLVVIGKNNPQALGFSPHGAGRNMSRTKFKKTVLPNYENEAALVSAETKGIDARFFNGNADISELPSAYKDHQSIIKQIGDFGLAEIVDKIMPYGSIMNGNVTWKRRGRNKK